MRGERVEPLSAFVRRVITWPGKAEAQVIAGIDALEAELASLRTDRDRLREALRKIARTNELTADTDTQALDIVVDLARAALKDPRKR